MQNVLLVDFRKPPKKRKICKKLICMRKVVTNLYKRLYGRLKYEMYKKRCFFEKEKRRYAKSIL